MVSMFDTHVNLLSGTVQVAPDPSTTGTSLTLMPGDGARFQADIPVTLCPPNTQATFDNSEIAYVTDVDGNSLTLMRAQEGTNAMQVASGWQVIAGITAKSLTDIEQALDTKVNTVEGKGLSTEDYTTAEKTKLASVAAGATQNATDAALRDRTTHTGTQAISTVTGLQTALDNKQESGDYATNSALTSGLGGKADASHTHVIADTTGLQTALDSKVDSSEVGVNNGVASLDSGGKVPVGQLPSSIMEYKGVWDASTNTPSFIDGEGNTGDVYRVTTAGTQDLGSGALSFSVGDYLIYNGTVWEKSDTTDSVASVAGKTGIVSLDKTDVGLSNVNNTSDADKPISTATQAALDAKANASDTVNLTGNQTVAGVKTFSSSPVVPTATTNTQAVNKAQMDTALSAKQDADATLTALAAHNTNGILTQTAADTFTGRTITGTTNQVNVTNGDGVSGNPTLSLPQNIHTGASPTFAGQTLTGDSAQTSSATAQWSFRGAKQYFTASSFGNNAGVQYGIQATATDATNANFSIDKLNYQGYFVSNLFSVSSSGNVTYYGNQIPVSDSTYTNGTPTNYWSNTYTDRLYLNSTAYLDGGTAGQLKVTGLFMPVQAPTDSAPAYVKGAMYFDTTLNKLRIGGATGWETITSA